MQTVTIKLEELREDIRKDLLKGIMSTSEAIRYLSVNKNEFLRIKRDPKSKLRASKGYSGKWIARTVREEFLRIHGYYP